MACACGVVCFFVVTQFDIVSVPERSKGVDSSSTVFALVGSNPTADTIDSFAAPNTTPTTTPHTSHKHHLAHTLSANVVAASQRQVIVFHRILATFDHTRQTALPYSDNNELSDSCNWGPYTTHKHQPTHTLTDCAYPQDEGVGKGVVWW